MNVPDLDPACLRAFLAVADTGSFTAASQRLARSQSAISLQVKRLEEQLGTELLDRGPRRTRLSPAGERLIDRARKLIALNEEMALTAKAPEVVGTVRLGVPEDFATTHLPRMLAEFVRVHPRISLEVTCELTLPILDRFASGEFDIALVKRLPGGAEGHTILREQLVWAAGSSDVPVKGGDAMPLVCSPRPCVLRDLATKSLDREGYPWRIAFSSGSLAGNHAALRAGLGIAPLPHEMVPSDLRVIASGLLPPLPDIETALLEASVLPPAAQVLRDTIVEASEHALLTAG